MRGVVLLVFFVVAFGQSAAHARARSGAATIFQAPRELRSDDGRLRAAALEEIGRLGADWLRIVLYWNDVAPRPESESIPRFDERDPRTYDWSRYDRVVDAADARGLRILMTLSGPVPRWATRARRDHVTRPSAARFERFAYAAGRHFSGRVDAYSIWNEPNHPLFLRPQWTGFRTPTSAFVYRRLFAAGERGLAQSGAGSVPVLFGETAPRGTAHVVAPLTFLRTALCLTATYRWRRPCHRLAIDGYAHHPYTTRAGPFFRPADRDDVTIGSLSRLNRALARAGRAGAVRRGLPVWLTEFGIQSWPDREYGVSQARQAEYLALSERIARRNRRVVSVAQYLLRDSDAAPRSGGRRHPGFESGLRTSSGRAKLALRGFMAPLAALRERARTRLWGLVRRAPAHASVGIEYRDRGGELWRPLARRRIDRNAAWTLTTATRRGRRYRVRWIDAFGRAHTGPPTRSYDLR